MGHPAHGRMVQVPHRPEPEPDPAHGRQLHQQLHHIAGGGADAEHPDGVLVAGDALQHFAGLVVLVVRIPDATALAPRRAPMAIRLLATGEKAAAVKFRRALSRAVDTTMAPRKKTCGAK